MNQIQPVLRMLHDAKRSAFNFLSRQCVHTYAQFINFYAIL